MRGFLFVVLGLATGFWSLASFAAPGDITLYKCVSHSDFSMHQLKILRVDESSVRCFIDEVEHSNCQFGNAGFNDGMYLWLTGGPLGSDLDELFCREE